MWYFFFYSLFRPSFPFSVYFFSFCLLYTCTGFMHFLEVESDIYLAVSVWHITICHGRKTFTSVSTVCMTKCPIVELDCYRPYLVDNDGYKWLNSVRFDLPRFKRPRQEVILIFQILRSKTCTYCSLLSVIYLQNFVLFSCLFFFFSENNTRGEIAPSPHTKNDELIEAWATGTDVARKSAVLLMTRGRKVTKK